MTLETQICEYASTTPDKVALISAAERVSYKTLWCKALAFAWQLRNVYQVSVGDRVVLSAAGNAEFVYAYLGVHIAGGICIPIDPDTNESRFRYIVDNTNPKAIFGVMTMVNNPGVLPFSAVELSSTEFNYSEPDINSIADILFTTGTTGSPKGVMLSYKNISAAINHINSFIGNDASDVELIALPVSHSFGLGRLRCTLAQGGTSVMLGTFANIKRFFRYIEEYGVTGFGMVPASWNFIKKMSGKYISKYANKLKYIEIGSSFMPVDDKHLLVELLPHTKICMHYGLTEASRSAYLDFTTDNENIGSAGKPSKGVDIQIFDTDGKRLGSEQDGEVCVKGEHVCCGYWNQNDEMFLNDFYGDYFRTGDFGFINKDGYLQLKSRIKEIINVGGKKVSPTEVEDAINNIPQIRECACIGIPDDVMGEVVKAFVVCNEDIDDKTIIDSLKSKIETYKIPVAIERVDLIPQTASGKIQRLKLK